MNALTIATAVSVLLALMHALYIVFLQRQLRSINRQLNKRLTEHTRQPISLELLSRELNTLAVNINKCLKAEENLRLHGIREEKRFKDLIANISHDLRTPLTAIKGYQQLLDNGELSGDQQKKLHIARKHADELGRLIEHFFEYSYLLSAEPEQHIERINLTNLVTDCLAASVTALEANKLTVRMEESPPIFVHTDKDMVTRMIQNLIRNCIQHSNGDIEVSLLQAVDRAGLSLRNPVKHAADLDVKRLFDRFYTGDQARSTCTGLGLSIVKLLAEQLGGSVIASMQDGVLEIRVELPKMNGMSSRE
ncbi:sensor histidine kinase [Paenibacillus spongiae]|uniref:histidine kinase n=1 Tax=Paenibacillus spongiae TaxID=2909671 RepID=A0ABY5S993_9BACL|nr:HAMP domain-containing sensor histidine kinase [Paenibacillus spongiae]UVI30239.1 HAMP domain-containing histidine kinase [Paenibacillus spongiae]